MNKAAISCIAMLVLALSGCSDEGGDRSRSYTLYRNSPLDLQMRVHFASFDADESEKYNSENCRLAADLLQKELLRMHDGLDNGVRYWCELGPYRP